MAEDWQPMETVPDDEQEIAVLAKDGAWIVQRDERLGWRIKAAPGRDPVLYISRPLGWMRLPRYV